MRYETDLSELFYAEGVHTVGIDRVIERAGVAKATLYSAFGSKDELIRAYLTRRHQVWQERVIQHLAGYPTPRDRLLGVFDWLGLLFARPEFHGCAFMNATAEDGTDGPAAEPAGAYRDSVLALFTELAQAAGAGDPGLLARQLALLYDGRPSPREWTETPERALPLVRSPPRWSTPRPPLSAFASGMSLK